MDRGIVSGPILFPLLASLTLAAPVFFVTPTYALSDEPTEYRMDDYRAPVPGTLSGAVVVDTETAHALWKAGGIAFIDVMPRPPKPADLPEGTIWREKPRLSVPGAIWLPNVGYGDLAPEMVDYFRRGLAKASGGDVNRPLLFFCLQDCWMSWNAAKRAVEWGHGRVYWYPDGMDGWTFNEFPTERVTAEPGDR